MQRIGSILSDPTHTSRIFWEELPACPEKSLRDPSIVGTLFIRIFGGEYEANGMDFGFQLSDGSDLTW